MSSVLEMEERGKLEEIRKICEENKKILLKEKAEDERNSEKDEKKKKEMEKRKVVQYVHAFGGYQQQSGRDNKTRAKLAAKLAQRKKSQNVMSPEDTEKEALRAQLLQEAAQAQIEMEHRRAEKIILEGKLRMFQERLELQLAEAAEYAAQKFLEEEEKREEKERWNKFIEMKKQEEEDKKKVEESVQVIIERGTEAYKQAVYSRLEQYELARFEFLRQLEEKFMVKQRNMEIARMKEEREAEEKKQMKEEEVRQENNKKIIRDYLENTPRNMAEKEVEQNENLVVKMEKLQKRDTSAERELKMKVLHKLKNKLEKRVMNRRQEKLNDEDLKNTNSRIHDDDEDERRSWDREDRMEHVQYMRRGFRGDF